MQYCIIAFIFLLNIVFHPSDYIYVNHIYDRPGYLTCDCVSSNDPCLTDQQCELENKCPESDGERTGIYVHESNRFILQIKDH